MSSLAFPSARMREAARKALRPIYRPMKRTARFTGWALRAAAGLWMPAADRRVLIVYDTSTQPFSIGDLLIFQEASLVLCERHGIDTVDMAILFDPQSPGSSDPVFASRIDSENVFFHLASVLPVAQVNQRLGSIFVFNSRRQLERLVSDNIDRYVVWPSGWDMSSREYLSPVVFNDLLRTYHAEHGSIPHLSCRPFLRRWAEGFYASHARGQVPVTVNLRNNPGWHLERNSKIDAWLAFFDDCATRYPAVFVVICARSEIDSRLRERPNVIVAKDHDTGVEQDMALISASAMHMGAGSGPATMAWFSDKPYLMVNTTFRIGEFFKWPEQVEMLDDGVQHVWYAGPLQRVANAVETPALLVREFARLWTGVDVTVWEARSAAAEDKELATWLR